MLESDHLDSRQLLPNNGPFASQLLRNRIEKEFNEGNIESSIYYQVVSLYGQLQDRYFNKRDTLKTALHSTVPSKTNHEDDTKPDKELLQYIKKVLKSKACKSEDFVAEFVTSCNFLRGIQDPNVGYNKIIETCNEFPKEWTVLQVCKGSRPQSTYLVFRELHELEADIYLTILRHARSSEYPDPICIHFSDNLQKKMFEIFANIPEKCKEYMMVKPEEVTTHEAKAKYWDNLSKLDKNVRDAIAILRAYIFPWIFVFRGVPSKTAITGSEKYQKDAFAEVDRLCNNFNLKLRERILLSLAALQVQYLTLLEIEAISEELSNSKNTQIAIQQLLQKFQTNLTTATKNLNPKKGRATSTSYTHTHYPCILVVDEQLDHFFWEELNVTQEICRVNSLHCLHKLYEAYKHRIRKGYLQVNLKKGACVINPDGSLPKTEMRMGAFFKYWAPNWPLKTGVNPTKEELLDDFFKRDCYFYAGHGSGLQHINGRRISKQSIDAVVFLFGCDSTRMSSSGLFSDLIGTHFYYHAAMCPCIVGTLLPALDAKMDEISVEIFSRWVAPKTNTTLKWDQVNSKLWSKQGIIEPIAADDKKNRETNKNQKYQMASLCGALTRVHARGEERFFYNTVSYVCRGLPAWNCSLQSLPE